MTDTPAADAGDERLEPLEPKALWGFFLALSKIPRGSRNESAAADWVAERGREMGGTVERDAVGNVLIRKAASPGREDRPTVALQCHVDMVCEKNEDTTHDFTRDPIRIWRDGDLLRARGTTLGADNGIGVASALAVLADDSLIRPALEVLVTIDEETGLTGATHLQAGWLTAATLLNLDSEAEGEVTIGCAGGVDTVAHRGLVFGPVAAGTRAFRVKVSGLKGGHSGIDIDAGRANALRLLGQTLEPLRRTEGFALAGLQGGNKRNAIPREASAIVVLPDAPANEAALRAQVALAAETWQVAYGAFDPHINLSVEPATATQVMRPDDASAVLDLLISGPHGVEAMSPAIPGLVQTSTNMGVAELAGGRFTICFLTRSAIESSKNAQAARIAAIATRAGFEVEHTLGYCGWKPEPGSAIVRLVGEVYRAQFGKEIEVKAIHAGLECGLFGEKYPNMEMASIGPSMWDVHTPDEHVSIQSVQNFWKFLRAVLAAL